MKYSLPSRELNLWKGRITESVVHCYVENVLIPTLQKVWSDAILVRTSLSVMPPKFERRVFLCNYLYPTPHFLERFENIRKICESVPDGFLLKLKKTGELRLLRKAVQELNVNFDTSLKEGFEQIGGTILWRDIKSDAYHEIYGERFPVIDMRVKSKTQIPIVDGEIELVEVKSGKSNVSPKQRANYGRVLNDGYILRFFYIRMVSFEENNFEIEERTIRNPNELVNFPIKP
jgi:hypothetical protein